MGRDAEPCSEAFQSSYSVVTSCALLYLIMAENQVVSTSFMLSVSNFTAFQHVSIQFATNQRISEVDASALKGFVVKVEQSGAAMFGVYNIVTISVEGKSISKPGRRRYSSPESSSYDDSSRDSDRS